MNKFSKARDIYENKYKLLMIIPIAILLISVGFLGYQKITTGEFVTKDISIKGGTQIIIQTSTALDAAEIENKVQEITGSSVSVRTLRGLGTSGAVGYSIELESGFSKEDILDAVQEATGLELGESQYSISETSPTLGDSFWTSALKAMALAFIFMSFVVFYYFRVPAPSLAVIAAAVSDVVGTIAITNMFGLKLSTGGVAALLMLIGYSVDTDILLSTKVLKVKTGDIISRVYSAAKTGLTMQIVALAALIVMWVLSPAQILKQIAVVLLVGLLLDMINTWIQNVGILRWYLERKNG